LYKGGNYVAVALLLEDNILVDVANGIVKVAEFPLRHQPQIDANLRELKRPPDNEQYAPRQETLPVIGAFRGINAQM